MTFGDLTQPGEGEPGKDCGGRYQKICLDCGHIINGEHWCMKRECPKCYEAWAWREAKSACEVLYNNQKGSRLYHGVVSIPVEIDRGYLRELQKEFVQDPGDIFKLRRWVYRFINDHNLHGGLLVPHFKRHGVHDGHWHYHFVAFARGRIEPGVDSKVVFTVIRRVRGRRDIKKLVSYLLTHCAIRNLSHAVTYFGSLKGAIKYKFPKIEPQCPKCGSYEVVNYPVIDLTAGYGMGDRVGLACEYG
jgi:hypothetical protein